MQISLPDDLYAEYDAAAKRARLSTPSLIARTLARMAATPITQRQLVLTGLVLEQVERTLGGGSLLSPEDLLTRTRALASISIGDIRLNFSPGQLAEIAHRAEKQGKSPQVIVEEIVKQMEENFFWGPVPTR